MSIDVPINLGSASGGSAGKASLAPLQAAILIDEGVPDLFLALSNGATMTATLSTQDPTGTFTPLTSSTLAMLSDVSLESARNANQQSVVDVALSLADATLTVGQSEVSYDEVGNVPSCSSTPCGCGANFALPSYAADAGAGVTLPPGTYAASRFGFSAENNVDIGAQTGGGGAGRSSPGGHTVRRPLGEDATCLFTSVSSGRTLSGQASFDVVSAVGQALGSPLYVFSNTLECLVHVSRVTIASDQAGEVWVDSEWGAGAHTYTVRTFDPVTGVEASSSSSSWSYVRNDASDQCQ
jgi:hypothetical protein